ncbi:histidine phosphatase family protein [bacterium]|nr:histidine phosphatase family protein [bacterium]
MTARRVLLVRHCEVDSRYRGVCYGRSDVGLSESGYANSLVLARRLAQFPVTEIWHSGLTRTRVVADALAALVLVPVRESRLLRERDFGEWELRTWDDLYRETGEAMLGSLREPATWRPPGGETTFECRDRVVTWYNSIPAEGVIVAVTHGGPIAALQGSLGDREVAAWPSLVPPTGTVLEL